METSAVSTTSIPFKVTSLISTKWKGRDISLIAAGVVVAFVLFIALLYYFSRGGNSSDHGNSNKSTTTNKGAPVDEVD